MPKVSAVFFDLDGTLRDSLDAVYGSLQHAVEVHTGKRPTRDDIRPHVHHHVAVHKALASNVPEDDFVQTFRDKLYPTQDDITLYDTAHETVRALHEKGYILAVVTSASHENSVDFVRKWALDEYFDAISGVTDTVHPKPAPDLILNALALTGCAPDETIMIGDLPADVACAHAAGVRCIGITHGFGLRDTLEAAGADYIVDTLTEIPALIEQIEAE